MIPVKIDMPYSLARGTPSKFDPRDLTWMSYLRVWQKLRSRDSVPCPWDWKTIKALHPLSIPCAWRIIRWYIDKRLVKGEEIVAASKRWRFSRGEAFLVPIIEGIFALIAPYSPVVENVGKDTSRSDRVQS